jgi:hypothetical protein
MDLAVKWRYFRHLLHGGDDDAERVYLWHIAARRQSGYVDGQKGNLDAYLYGARALFASMHRHGFDPHFPVPLDQNKDLLGGAHRVACALALGIDVIVQHIPQLAWAPRWDREWFLAHGCPLDDLQRICVDWGKLNAIGQG